LARAGDSRSICEASMGLFKFDPESAMLGRQFKCRSNGRFALHWQSQWHTQSGQWAVGRDSRRVGEQVASFPRLMMGDSLFLEERGRV
jgi:hypothetical protein